MIRRALLLLTAAWLTAPLFAQDRRVGEMTLTPEDSERMARSEFSPYAGRNFPTQVLWGDTHVHTANSLDARAFGVLLDPAQAYRFARGEEVTASGGIRVKLSRPLDWLVVADHSDAMGAMKQIIAGDSQLMRDPTVRDWNERLNAGGQAAFDATFEVIYAFTGIGDTPLPEVLLERRFVQSVWDEYTETAEAFNDPGTFTAVIGTNGPRPKVGTTFSSQGARSWNS